MRSQMDPVQVGNAKDLSEMQFEIMGNDEDPQEMNPEDVRYRVLMSDLGRSKAEDDLLFLDYFSDYEYANSVFDSIAEDTDFIKHYKRDCVEVLLQRAYRGLGSIFWETIRKTVVYNTETQL